MKNLFGEEIPTDLTCGECKYFYWKHVRSGRKFGKCNRKPWGWGYDIPKKHKNCQRFKRRDEP